MLLRLKPWMDQRVIPRGQTGTICCTRGFLQSSLGTKLCTIAGGEYGLIHSVKKVSEFQKRGVSDRGPLMDVYEASLKAH